MKGHALYQGEIITNYRKYIDEIKKIFFSRTTELISTKLGTKHSWVKGTHFCSNEGSHPLSRGDINGIVKIHDRQNLKSSP